MKSCVMTIIFEKTLLVETLKPEVITIETISNKERE